MLRYGLSVVLQYVILPFTLTSNYWNVKCYMTWNVMSLRILYIMVRPYFTWYLLYLRIYYCQISIKVVINISSTERNYTTVLLQYTHRRTDQEGTRPWFIFIKRVDVINNYFWGWILKKNLLVRTCFCLTVFYPFRRIQRVWRSRLRLKRRVSTKVDKVSFLWKFDRHKWTVDKVWWTIYTETSFYGVVDPRVERGRFHEVESLSILLYVWWIYSMFCNRKSL